MKRVLDLLFAITLLAPLLPVLIIISILIKVTSRGPAIYWSKRVGINNNLFMMPKFRSMHVNAPQVATHLLSDSQKHITTIGAFLRKTSLDELPQLYSVIRGDMSFVGPRPALFNQDDLIKLRTSQGIEKLKPGITGWAQINGRDELPIPKKVDLDKYYLEHQSLALDIKILFLTAYKVFKSEGVSH